MWTEKTNNRLYVVALLFLIANFAFAFYQHYHAILDGDMSLVAVPAPNFVRVLHDPLGLGVLLHGDHYNATNRFVLHASIYAHFRTWPFFFQKFTDPISSVYLASALAKTVWQIAFTYLIGVYVSGSFRIFNGRFLLAAVLLTPLFQNCGYVWDIGIIDPPISYAFSYAFSVLLVGIFFLPFFLLLFHKRNISFGPLLTGVLLVLSWAVAFNGPVSAPVIILGCGFMWLELFRQRWVKNSGASLNSRLTTTIKELPKPVMFITGFAVLMAFYSFYVGKNNIENFTQQMSLAARYQRLPSSIIHMFSGEGLVLLMSMIGVNLAVLASAGTTESRKMLRLFVWIAIFASAYMLLLPLGGYRFYRPQIVRRDVMVPVTTALIAFYVLSAYYLITNIRPVQFKLYLFIVLIPLARLFLADKMFNQFDNSCERRAMSMLAAAKEKVVELPGDCTVMEWYKVTTPADSKKNTDMMRVLGIISEEKLYYQK
ncbi:MAG: hypothetical protein IAE95_08070 [Chitinophagaceae bacterium]|nr:hypothetical protein [Chitinophagaceae bacterium]